MALHEIDDLALPNFICGNSLVIIKFTADDCPVCVELAPAFRDLAALERYSGIEFVKMDASENPVASNQVKSTGGTPFMATYRNGSLVTCKVVSSEADIVNMLENLLR